MSDIIEKYLEYSDNPIDYYRKQRGITQEKLAKIIGVHRNSIFYNNSNYNKEILEKLAGVLGVDTEDLELPKKFSIGNGMSNVVNYKEIVRDLSGKLKSLPPKYLKFKAAIIIAYLEKDASDPDCSRDLEKCMDYLLNKSSLFGLSVCFYRICTPEITPFVTPLRCPHLPPEYPTYLDYYCRARAKNNNELEQQTTKKGCRIRRQTLKTLRESQSALETYYAKHPENIQCLADILHIELSDLIKDENSETSAFLIDIKNVMEEITKAISHCKPRYLKKKLAYINRYLEWNSQDRFTKYIDLILNYLLRNTSSKHKQIMYQEINDIIEKAKSTPDSLLNKGSTSDIQIVCSKTDKENYYEAYVLFEKRIYDHFGLIPMFNTINWPDDVNSISVPICKNDFKFVPMPKIASDFPIKFSTHYSPNTDNFHRTLKEQILQYIYTNELEHLNQNFRNGYVIFRNYFELYYNKKNIFMLENGLTLALKNALFTYDQNTYQDSYSNYQKQLQLSRIIIDKILGKTEIPEQQKEQLAQTFSCMTIYPEYNDLLLSINEETE